MFGVPQLYIKLEVLTILLLVAKVTNDFLVSGKMEDIIKLMEELKGGFDIGNISIEVDFSSNGSMVKVWPGYN